jgi:hypothetical protein
MLSLAFVVQPSGDVPAGYASAVVLSHAMACTARNALQCSLSGAVAALFSLLPGEPSSTYTRESIMEGWIFIWGKSSCRASCWNMRWLNAKSHRDQDLVANPAGRLPRALQDSGLVREGGLATTTVNTGKLPAASACH